MFKLGDFNNTEDKKADKNEELKKKRDQYFVEIRKLKRDELLFRKRRKNLLEEIKPGNEDNVSRSHNLGEDPQLRECIDVWLTQSFNMAEFPQIIEAINSNDRFQRHYGVIGLRKILSNENGPPIQPVIDANLIPRLITFMQGNDGLHLQLEATWALTNVASGTTEQTQSIIDKGGIPSFIRLLKSERMEIAEQAIWAIGNISGDSSDFRDIILKYGGLYPLIELVNNTKNFDIVKNGTWALSNLCRGKPLPELKLVEAAIPTFCAVLSRETDHDVLTEAAWALSYLTRVESKIQEIIEMGLIPRLIDLLEHPYLALVVPCVRILGNIIVGTEEQANCVLGRPDFIQRLFRFLLNKKKSVRKETCWTISNITAGTSSQIELVIGTPGYVAKLIELAETDFPEVKKEATWALSNATKHSTPQQMVRIIEMGVLDCFINLLNSDEPKIVEIVLEAINNILNLGASVAHNMGGQENEFLVVLENKGGVKKIEELQKHKNNDVYRKALNILETHFEIDNFI